MRLDEIKFPPIRLSGLSDEDLRITEEEILADLLYPFAPPHEGVR